MRDDKPEVALLRWVTLSAAVLGFVAIAPLWAPLVLAAWFADLLRPLSRRLARALRGEKRGAAATTFLLLFGLVLPLVGAGASLIGSLHASIGLLTAAIEGRGGLAALVAPNQESGAPSHFDLRELIDLGTKHGASVLKAATTLMTASLGFGVGIFIFTYALYEFIVKGSSAFAWLEKHSPIPNDALLRFAAAFRETGRGLLVGTGLTAVVQGVLAGIAYAALGVPRALALGVLTAVASLLPAFGTALVWAPVSIGLLVAGHPIRALILAAIGAGFIGTVDNILRPFLTRFGDFTLPSFVVLLSILGGIGTFGGWGILLGPLLVRLAVEGLDIARDAKLFGEPGATNVPIPATDASADPPR